MTWGDYGALEGISLRGYGLGEPSPQPGVFTGPFRALTPSSALNEGGEGRDRVSDVQGIVGAAGSPAKGVAYGAPGSVVTRRQDTPTFSPSLSALSGAAVSPHQQEPGPPGSPAVPPLTEAGGTTAHDPAAAPLSALTEDGMHPVDARARRTAVQSDSPSSVSVLVALDAVRAQP